MKLYGESQVGEIDKINKIVSIHTMEIEKKNPWYSAHKTMLSINITCYEIFLSL